ncbi:MAG: dynamin family protein [Planctomycetales bacterium]|nr:dynamin family protein [Planctomycetales bacterium]
MGIAAYVLSYVLKKADELPDAATGELPESQEGVITGDLGTLQLAHFAAIGVAESASHQSRHLDDLRKVCELLHADSISPSIDAIERLAQQQLFRVMFVGRYNSGKSTLLNRLLGGEFLLPGPTPTTRAMTFILPGKSPQLTSQHPDGRLTLHDNIADLKDRKNVAIVDAKQLSLLLPAEILKSGICLIDTPGIEDPNEDTTRLMQAEVQHCEAVVLMLDSTLQIGAAEEAFIQNMMREDRARKLFVVANKIDKLPPDRVSVVLDAIRSHLLQLDVQPRVFGLAAKAPNDYGDVGVADFRAALTAFLESGRSQEQQRIVDHQIRSLAGQLVGSAKAQAEFADMAESDRESKLQRLRQHQSEVNKAVATKQQEVKLVLTRMETTLQSEFEMFCHDLASTVCRQIDESTLDQLRKSDLIERLIHQETRSFLEPKLEAIEAELGDAANEAVHGAISDLQRSRVALKTSNSKLALEENPEIVTGILLVLSFSFMGIFSFLYVLIGLSFGRSMLENSIKAIASKFAEAKIKSQLKDQICDGLTTYRNKMSEKLHEQFVVLELSVTQEIAAAIRSASAEEEGVLALNDSLIEVSRTDISEANKTLSRILKDQNRTGADHV